MNSSFSDPRNEPKTEAIVRPLDINSIGGYIMQMHKTIYSIVNMYSGVILREFNYCFKLDIQAEAIWTGLRLWTIVVKQKSMLPFYISALPHLECYLEFHIKFQI